MRIVVYYNGTFIHLRNGAHARLTSLLQYLVKAGYSITLFSFENHPTEPWTEAARAALRARHRQVDRLGDHVGEIVKLESTLVGDDSPATSQRQPRRHHVLVRAGREVAQAIEPTPDPPVAAAGTCVVAQRAAVHSRFERLAGSEVARL